MKIGNLFSESKHDINVWNKNANLSSEVKLYVASTH